jgi:hypothetical protein
MSAHTVGTAVSEINLPGLKLAIVPVTLSASYDAGGSNADFSSVFTTVRGATPIGDANGTTSNTKYQFTTILGASGSGTTVKIKVNDATQAADAEASGDISALIVNFLVLGT